MLGVLDGGGYVGVYYVGVVLCVVVFLLVCGFGLWCVVVFDWYVVCGGVGVLFVYIVWCVEFCDVCDVLDIIGFFVGGCVVLL